MTARRLLRPQGVRQGGLLVALLLATLLFPNRAGLGTYLLGATTALPLAMQAVGIVLVYRSNRIINFAQVPLGALGAYLFQVSATYRPLLRWFGFLCGNTGCGSTAIAVNYWISLLVCLLVPVLLGGLVYYLVVRRFASAPRLLLTVGTIFVGPAIYAAFPYIRGWLSTPFERQRIPMGGSRTAFPVSGNWDIAGTQFHAVDLVNVVVSLVVVAAIVAYLRYSRAGLAVRAAAENTDRASTLGVDVGGVTVRIWLLAGLLSGIASMVSATTSGHSIVGSDVRTLLLILTAAAIGGLVSLPLALIASVVLGAVKVAAVYSFGNPVPLTGSLVLVLAATFALQRVTAARSEIELASTLATGREARPVPRELTRLPSVVAWRRTLVVAVFVVVCASPLLLSPGQVDHVTTVMVFTIVVLSLLILTGWAGQISLGQIGFAGLGAYVTIACGLPVYVALPLGVLAGAVAATIVGLPALRLRGLHLAVISLAFAVAIADVVIDPGHGGQVLPIDFSRPKPLGISLEDPRVFYYLVLVALVLSVIGVLGLRRSRAARALIAARDNELAAQSLGVNLLQARLVAFALSGGLAAFGGAVLAYQQHSVRVGTFDPQAGIDFFQMAVLGGMGHVSGPLLGSAALQLPPVFNLPDWIVALITGPGALAVVLTIPGGISQALFNSRDNVLRRLARREGIYVPALQGAHSGLDERAPLLPPTETTGAEVYVPERYRLTGQWALRVPEESSR